MRCDHADDLPQAWPNHSSSEDKRARCPRYRSGHRGHRNSRQPQPPAVCWPVGYIPLPTQGRTFGAGPHPGPRVTSRRPCGQQHNGILLWSCPHRTNRDGRWAVQKIGTKRASKLFDTKTPAVARARAQSEARRRRADRQSPGRQDPVKGLSRPGPGGPQGLTVSEEKQRPHPTGGTVVPLVRRARQQGLQRLKWRAS